MHDLYLNFRQLDSLINQSTDKASTAGHEPVRLARIANTHLSHFRSTAGRLCSKNRPRNHFLDMSVLAKPCMGSNTTSVVEHSVFNSATVNLDLGQDTGCYLCIDVTWTSASSITQVLVPGFTTYQTLNGEDNWVIQLDASSGTDMLVSGTGKS
ncbi:MAG: hypothetical protein ACJATT_003821 [Myxococcota bacterium]